MISIFLLPSKRLLVPRQQQLNIPLIIQPRHQLFLPQRARLIHLQSNNCLWDQIY